MKKMLRFVLLLIVVLGIAGGVGLWKVRQMADSKILIKEETVFTLKAGTGRLALGEQLYTQYAFAVEVGAVLLLVGMVAAIALTLRRRRDVKYNDPGAALRVRAKDRVRLLDIPSQEAFNAKSGEQS